MPQKFFAMLIVLLLSLTVFAGENLESDDLNLVAAHAHRLAEKYGTEQVLVVYDIDNTLLAANQDLGSDQWFTWQSSLIAAGDFTNAVAKDIPGLLKAQGLLFAVGKMHPPQADASALVNGLQSEGFTTLILTSRGPEFRSFTERELQTNGYDLTRKPLGEAGFAGTYLPYDLDAPEQSCLEKGKLGLGPAQPVSLVGGVMMTSGQHKGAMLRSLLCRLHRSFAAIVFADDTPKHVVRMHDAFDELGVDVVTIRYSREDAKVESFLKGDKSVVVAAWEKLKQTLESLFP
jgi:hypothetical protein